MITVRGEVLKGDVAVKASDLTKKLKNVIMQILLKNRESRKVPKLKDILKDAINRQHKAQALKRKEEKADGYAFKLIRESLS